MSKLCKNTFANYAFTQIKKARGLNKKIVNPMEKERRSVEDFCLVLVGKKSMPLKQFLYENGLKSKHCGLAKVTKIKDCYHLFYNASLNYKGIARPGANEVCLSSIPKEEPPIAMLYFNLDGYSSYCKKHKAYWTWVNERNEERYKSNTSHDKNYDAKNMMHTFRLLHMAKEIGIMGKINVERSDRDYLLAIKNAEFEYDDLVAKAKNAKEELEVIFNISSLPEKPDLEAVNSVLFSIRHKFYNQNFEN
ncbi:MAG: hypothetical protein AAFX55_20870 [Bacteroidota bacterium]